MNPNPCLSCGACCAFYRASFYWIETDDFTPEGVPVELTRKMNDFRTVMIGSYSDQPKCIALEGEIGKEVKCRIYENRSSVCRNFTPSWLNGTRNKRCDKARSAWGMPLLSSDDWPDNFPHAA